MSTGETARIRRRALLIGTFILVAGIGYIVLFVALRAGVSGEQTFAAAPIENGMPLDVYLDVTAIDPVRESMDVRLDLATGPGPHGTHYGGALKRDVELYISDGDSEQEFRLHRDSALAATVFAAGLTGEVSRYPFDRYSTRIVVRAIESTADRIHRRIPVRATVWEGVPAWMLSVTKQRTSDATELMLAFDVHRPAPLVVFGSLIYGLMVLIAISAIAIGFLVFVGVRRLEVTLLGALAAMAFALPGMRNILPGAPPIGVLADILILLWAEMFVVIGVTLFVTAWVRRGPRA